MKTKGYPTLKWSALQAGKRCGLPFLDEDGNFTSEFKVFWQIFEEDIHKWDSERRMLWTQTNLSLIALIISIIALVIRLVKL